MRSPLTSLARSSYVSGTSTTARGPPCRLKRGRAPLRSPVEEAKQEVTQNGHLAGQRPAATEQDRRAAMRP